MIREKRLSRILAAPLFCAALAGCTVGPSFQPPKPEVPAAWNAASPSTDGAQASRPVAQPADDAATWWTRFDDAELTNLIGRARQANLDARTAVLRVAEARAQRDIADADRWPSLNTNASAQVNRLSENTPTGSLFNKIGAFPGLSGVRVPIPYEQYQLGFDASWEVDLFGRVRRSVEAAGADSEAQAEDARAVLITVLGDVGRAYIDLRGAQAKRQIAVDTIATARDLGDLAGQRRGAGLSSDIDVARSKAAVSAAEAQLTGLDREIAGDINQLSRLLALPPGALSAELAAARPVPPVPPTVPIGLPADLARRRPDIREAEARLHAASARIGVAVAGLYPKLTLVAQGGLQSQDVSGLAAWASRFVNAGPMLELPVFDAGRRRASVRLQDVRAKEAALAYQGAVLGALHEVDNALIAYAADQARRVALADAVAQDSDAVGLSRQRYAAGVAAFIDVLNAEQALEQNQLLEADATAAVSTDLVVLYKALGGGWG